MTDVEKTSMRMKLCFAFGFLVISFCVGFGCDKKGAEPDTQPVPQRVVFVEHPIDVHFDGIHCIELTDLDGDGDQDIVGGSEITPYSQSRGLAWWRNGGGNPPGWTRLTIDSNFSHVMSVGVGDIDGDVFPDVIATSWNMHQVAWWRNSGSPVSNWSKNIIQTDFTNAHDARGCDIENDGPMDVVGIISSGAFVVCYNDDNSPIDWEIQSLSQTFSGGKSVVIIDIDRDGDPDILGTAADIDRISWWENRGGRPVVWVTHSVATQFVGSTGIDVLDMNGDGLYDIIGTAYKSDEVACWICEDLMTDQWRKIVVTDRLDVAVNARGADFDQDGQIDIAAVGKIPGEVAIYFNDDFSWTKQTIKSNFEGGTALAVVDLDDDGDLDVISGASALGSLYWWENRTIIQ